MLSTLTSSVYVAKRLLLNFLYFLYTTTLYFIFSYFFSLRYSITAHTEFPILMQASPSLWLSINISYVPVLQLSYQGRNFILRVGLRTSCCRSFFLFCFSRPPLVVFQRKPPTYEYTYPTCVLGGISVTRETGL